jgi:hypothetical protein
MPILNLKTNIFHQVRFVVLNFEPNRVISFTYVFLNVITIFVSHDVRMRAICGI